MSIPTENGGCIFALYHVIILFLASQMFKRYFGG